MTLLGNVEAVAANILGTVKLRHSAFLTSRSKRIMKLAALKSLPMVL